VSAVNGTETRTSDKGRTTVDVPGLGITGSIPHGPELVGEGSPLRRTITLDFSKHLDDDIENEQVDDAVVRQKVNPALLAPSCNSGDSDKPQDGFDRLLAKAEKRGKIDDDSAFLEEARQPQWFAPMPRLQASALSARPRTSAPLVNRGFSDSPLIPEECRSWSDCGVRNLKLQSFSASGRRR
jgi:hypothetical protein